MEINAGGSCDYCWCLSFFGFLRPELSTWRYMNRCFKETKLGSSDQEASLSAGKNTWVVLVPCWCMEVHPYSYFQWCGYFWGPWVSFVTTLSSQWGPQKLIQELISDELKAYLCVFDLFKLHELWPYYQKYVNQIILKPTTL